MSEVVTVSDDDRHSSNADIKKCSLHADNRLSNVTSEEGDDPVSLMDSEKAYRLGESYLNGDGVEMNYKAAFDYYKIAADQGYAEAQYRLGYIYDNGLGLDQDYATAIVWYKKAAYQNHITANYRLGRMHFYEEGVEKNNDLVFQYYKVAAELGDAESQYQFGLCYKMGYGVEQSYEKVIPWHLKAADQGHIYSKYDLGIAYYYGLGVEIDYEIAFKYMIEADSRNPSSYYLLGDENFYGKGCEKNYEVAFQCYKFTAQHDIDDSRCQLAIMYHFGYGTEKDERLAIEWYTKATSNDTIARLCLAELYHSASKEFQDFSKAYEWYHSELDDSSKSFAIRSIGLFYEHGDLFEQDYKKALDHYLQAAEDKNVAAYFNIARLYYFGYGVEQCFTKCLEWLSKIENERPRDHYTYVYVQSGKEEFSRQFDFSKDKRYSTITEHELFGKVYCLLGFLYTHGEGVERNLNRAKKYFQVALEKGIEEAQKYIQEINEEC